MITPPLDGTILPGITRAAALALADAHTVGDITLPGVPSSLKIYAHEKTLTMEYLSYLHSEGRILEFFGVGTAAVVAPVKRVGWNDKELSFPQYDSLGPVGRGIYKMITSIQTG